MMTHQNQVETSCSPFLYGFQPVFRSLVLDLLLPQKHGQDILIDGIILSSA